MLTIAAPAWTPTREVLRDIDAILRADLAEFAGCFVDVRWIATDCGLTLHDRRLTRRLAGLSERGALAFVFDEVIAVPPATPEQWEAAKTAVLGLIRAAATIGYAAILEGAGMPERSVMCILQVLGGDGTIEVDMPAGAQAWEAMTFKRVPGRSPPRRTRN